MLYITVSKLFFCTYNEIDNDIVPGRQSVEVRRPETLTDAVEWTDRTAQAKDQRLARDRNWTVRFSRGQAYNRRRQEPFRDEMEKKKKI